MKVKQEGIFVRDLTDGYVDDGEGGVRGFGGKLDIRPPYQREFIYEEKQRDEVIRTVAKGFPLNSMYWAVREGGDFEIIDGQQRTISLCMFVAGDFSVEGLFDTKEPKFFEGLIPEDQKAILDYALTVYQCSGNDREKLDWFETINIAGKELSKQELRNAVYSGKWVTDAKGWFSRGNCQANIIGGKYLTGEVKRQKYLETAIGWAAAVDDIQIEEYMARHQQDENAQELWNYFKSVIDWINKIFPKYRAPMKGIGWGDLYLAHKNKTLDATDLERKIAELMKDDEVVAKKGIYPYVLTGVEKHLNLRAFSDSQKATAYEQQGGKCGKGVKGGKYGCGKPFPFGEMQGDHITPWSKEGKTTDDNCQMLCQPCNILKSNK
ncbi:MAG: DUF262 domain-containing protein [Betaproteobacteria bacterium]|nr:DUF262 domain-containing protein [Betaproteobacteria bacterium]